LLGKLIQQAQYRLCHLLTELISETDPRANQKYNIETELREKSRPTQKVVVEEKSTEKDGDATKSNFISSV